MAKRIVFAIFLTGFCLFGSIAFSVEEEVKESPEQTILKQLEDLWAKAEAGDSDASLVIGAAYFFRNEGIYDQVQMDKWLSWAAESGSYDAMYNLGQMYANGYGTSQNYVRAHMWYSLAAESAKTEYGRKRATAARDRTAEKMTSSELAESEKLAKTHQPK